MVTKLLHRSDLSEVGRDSLMITIGGGSDGTIGDSLVLVEEIFISPSIPISIL